MRHVIITTFFFCFFGNGYYLRTWKSYCFFGNGCYLRTWKSNRQCYSLIRRDDSLLIVNPLPRNLLPPNILPRGNDEKEKICMVQLLEQEVQKSNKGFRKPSNKPLFSVAVSFSFGISPRGKAKEEGKRWRGETLPRMTPVHERKIGKRKSWSFIDRISL